MTRLKGTRKTQSSQMPQRTTQSGNVLSKRRSRSFLSGICDSSASSAFPRAMRHRDALWRGARARDGAHSPQPSSHCLTADSEWLSPRRWRAQRSTSARRSAVGRSAVAGGALQSSLDQERTRTTPRDVGRSMRSSNSGSPWPPPTSSCRVSPEDAPWRSRGVTSPGVGRRPSRRRAAPDRAMRTCITTTPPASTDRVGRRA